MSTTARILNDSDSYRREELIDGEVVVMSATPSSRHSCIVHNLTRLFGNYLHGKSCRVYSENLEVHLSERDHYVPDITVVCDRSKLIDDIYYGAPALVVEVLSPSTAKYDRFKKLPVYRQAGVQEYWIVDINNCAIEVYHPQDGSEEIYFDPSVAKREEGSPVEFVCGVFPDLIIRLEDVFYDLW